jgi:hypothetical protein
MTNVTKLKQDAFSATSLLNGINGEALRAMTLSAINFELGRQIANHPTLKMPTSRPDTPDALRDLVAMPELEGRDTPNPLDHIVDALVASCALIKDVAQRSDFDTSGRIIYPYAWIANSARTPASAVADNFAWRSNMAAKVAGEKAVLLGMSNAKEVEDKAKARNEAENAERMAYALAEVNSVTNTNIMKEDEANLIEMLLDLRTIDIMKLAKSAAQGAVERARTRLLEGQYATIDEEVLLFANS